MLAIGKKENFAYYIIKELEMIWQNFARIFEII